MTDDTLQQEYLGLIGQIVVAWTATEEICDVVLAGLLNIDQRLSKSITTPIMSFSTRSDIMKSVAKQSLDDDAFNEFVSILSKVRSAYKTRNLVAHGYWLGLNLEEPLLQQKKIKLVPAVNTEKFSRRKLLGMLKQIGNAQTSLGMFAMQHKLIPTYEQRKE